jgi:TatD DNase family protein
MPPSPSDPSSLFVDTHAHLYSRQFESDREQMLDRMLESGVRMAFLPNIDLESIPPMHALCDHRPDVCIPMMGLHPCHVGEDWVEVLQVMVEWLDRRPYAAVGEIGLDAYWDKSTLPRQEEAFRVQIRWANERGLPIVIHSRETMEDCIRIVEEERDAELKGVFHCFTGTSEQAGRIIAMGFHLGVGGVYTYKNSGLTTALANIPLESLVLETDAPYLAPVPHRGKRNESAYISLIAARLAEDRRMSVEELARRTTANAALLFSQADLL